MPTDLIFWDSFSSPEVPVNEHAPDVHPTYLYHFDTWGAQAFGDTSGQIVGDALMGGASIGYPFSNNDAALIVNGAMRIELAFYAPSEEYSTLQARVVGLDYYSSGFASDVSLRLSLEEGVRTLRFDSGTYADSSQSQDGVPIDLVSGELYTAVLIYANGYQSCELGGVTVARSLPLSSGYPYGLRAIQLQSGSDGIDDIKIYDTDFTPPGGQPFWTAFRGTREIDV